MSIAHMAYVRCDGCGDPAGCADDAKEARQLARAAGYTREGSDDLCHRCKQLPAGERPWDKDPPILYVEAADG